MMDWRLKIEDTKNSASRLKITSKMWGFLNFDDQTLKLAIAKFEGLPHIFKEIEDSFMCREPRTIDVLWGRCRSCLKCDHHYLSMSSTLLLLWFIVELWAACEYTILIMSPIPKLSLEGRQMVLFVVIPPFAKWEQLHTLKTYTMFVFE